MEYKNRKNDTYYLHQGKTKTGKLKYYFSREKSEISVDIPEDYEIYENPNAQVFLRKKLPKMITESELAIVSQGVHQYAELEYFKVEAKKNTIVIFLPNQNINEFEKLFSSAPFVSPLLFTHIKKERAMEVLITYSPIMRFVLIDEETREFQAERWCFRGSIEDWVCLGKSDDLAQLVKQYCKHLGKDSFYDLF